MLTKEFILRKYPKISDITSLTKLNIYAEDIQDISILASMPKLEYLSLSCNQISSLLPLSNCIYLREIYLRNNKISSFEELNHLQHLFNLKILWLDGNPICNDKYYRNKVLNILPQVVSLDNKNRKIKNESSKTKFRNLSEKKELKNKLDKNDMNNISKSHRKKMLMRRVFSNYTDTNDDINIDVTNNISLKQNNIKHNNYLYSDKKRDLNEFKIRFNSRAHNEQREKDKTKKIYKKLKLKLKTEENKNNIIHIHPKLNKLFYIPKIGENNITVQNSIHQEREKFNFFRNENRDKLFVNNCFGNNNYIMKTLYLLVDKMNVNDLVTLKKFINKRIAILSNVN